jgi:hypothetical protein
MPVFFSSFLFHLSPDFEVFKTICSDCSITSRKNGQDRHAMPSPLMLLLAFIIPLPLFAVGLSAAVQTGCASVHAAKSAGCVICSIYNRSILSGGVSVFHELTPCLVFMGRRVSPTILRSTTPARFKSMMVRNGNKCFGCPEETFKFVLVG